MNKNYPNYAAGVVTNPGIRTITVSPNVCEITKIRPGCFLVSLNKKPLQEFCELATAQTYARRWGWKPDGTTGNPASMLNERPGKMTPSKARAYLATDRELMANEGVRLSTGPTMKFA